ncbi:hypothetical protein ESCOMMO153M_22550 [Escherichia coli]
MPVQEAADIKVLLVSRITIFTAFQNVIKDDRCQFFVDRREIDINVTDLVFDLFFFVGQEHIFIFNARNEHQAFKRVETFFDPAAQLNFIGIDPIDRQCDQVIQGAFQRFHIADQEQRFKQVAIELIKNAILASLSDGAANGRFQEALNGGIEAPERHQRIQPLR